MHHYSFLARQAQEEENEDELLSQCSHRSTERGALLRENPQKYADSEHQMRLFGHEEFQASNQLSICFVLDKKRLGRDHDIIGIIMQEGLATQGPRHKQFIRGPAKEVLELCGEKSLPKDHANLLDNYQRAGLGVQALAFKVLRR